MEEPNSNWEAPPPPEKIDAPPVESAQMSEVATLGNIFFDPGATFEDLRRKPRFLLGMLVIVVLISAFQATFIEKVGLRNIVKARVESSSRAAQMPEDQKKQLIDQQSSNVVKYISYGSTPVVVIVAMFIGGLLYWFGISAVGGKSGYLNAVSVWTYSSIPPTVVAMLANFAVLMIKPVDDIDLASSQQGLVSANLTMFLDLKSSPVLNTVVSAIDLFAIWGLVLAAIGISRVGRVSTAAAWGVALVIWLVFLAIRVVGAAIFG